MYLIFGIVMHLLAERCSKKKKWQFIHKATELLFELIVFRSNNWLISKTYRQPASNFNTGVVTVFTKTFLWSQTDVVHKFEWMKLALWEDCNQFFHIFPSSYRSNWKNNLADLVHWHKCEILKQTPVCFETKFTKTQFENSIFTLFIYFYIFMYIDFSGTPRRIWWQVCQIESLPLYDFWLLNISIYLKIQRLRTLKSSLSEQKGYLTTPNLPEVCIFFKKHSIFHSPSRIFHKSYGFAFEWLILE